MFWISASSPDLRAVAHDAGSLVLSIRFHSGGVCHYHGVSAGIYQGLMSAGSKER